MAEEWPRKALPGSAHMLPDARQAIQRLGAGLTLLGEDKPGAGAGLRENRVGPLRPLPSAGLHCTRRCSRPSSPGSGSPQWACRGNPAPPLFVSASASLPGRPEVGTEDVFVMRLEALLEVPSPRAS